MVTAVAHGLGIGLYALLSISGIAVMVTATPVLFTTLQWLGAAYLIWLAFKGIRASTAVSIDQDQERATGSAVRNGFLVVFFNPKVAVFFIALFSQIIGSETSWLEKLIYASTAMLIDIAWYLIVAWSISNPRWLGSLQKNSLWIERVFAVVLFALAMRLIAGGLFS